MSETRTCKGCGKPIARREGEPASAFDKRQNCDRRCAALAVRAVRTDARPYESRLGRGWVSPAEYLAELMCERQSRHYGKPLGPNWWDEPFWKKTFGHQLRLAKALLQVYPAPALGRALRSRKGKMAYSLAAPFLVDLVKGDVHATAEQAWPLLVPNGELPPPLPDVVEPPRPAFVPAQSNLSKLKDLD